MPNQTLDTDVRKLEELEREETEKTYSKLKHQGKEPGRIEVPKNWGIRKTVDLPKLTLPDLENLYYGTYNINVPSEMRDVQNPEEILANYIATGILKRNNGHKHLNLPIDFLDLVAKMNKHIYSGKNRSRIAFRKMMRGATRKPYERFPSESGDLRKRLESLNPEIKEQFVESFFSDYIPSQRESKTHGRFLDYGSKTFYTENAFDKIAADFRKHRKD